MDAHVLAERGSVRNRLDVGALPSPSGGGGISTSFAMHETKSVLCVKAEIHNVLTSLRHGSDRRWSSKKRFEHEIPLKEEHTLLRGFKELHFYLEDFEDLREVDTVEYLKPFLQVVTSQHTNAAITMVALRSLNKFLLYDFISADSPRANHAINDMAHALARCRRFNERVLMQLMQVSELVVRNPAGRLLTDDHICELFKVCFRVCRSLDASILLRQSAESTLSHIIITVFGRVTVTTATAAAPELSEPILGTPRIEDATGQDGSAKGLLSPEAVLDQGVKDGIAPPKGGEEAVAEKVDESLPSAYREGPSMADVIPYGPSCLIRLLNFIGSLINPLTQDEDVRVLGLSLLNTILETGGEMLGSIPQIVDLIQSQLCKYLLQDSQTEELPVLALVLRVIFNLFNSIKSHLKVQLEVFFTSVHLGICESRSELVTSEQKEIALESLLEFCREPALMVDLYKNYDCDVQCTNLFETLCGCLCRNAVPLGGRTGRLTILHTLSLEAILAVLDSIARRCTMGAEGEGGGDVGDESGATIGVSIAGTVSDVDGESGASPSILSSPRKSRNSSGSVSRSYSDSVPNTPEWFLRNAQNQGKDTEAADSLQQQKQMKKLMKAAAEKFNTDKKGWMRFALDAGLLQKRVETEETGKITYKTAADPNSVAHFLRVTPGLDKTLVGDYLAEPADKHKYPELVLDAYTGGFDFVDVPLVEGLRIYLESFRLPGEAQKIDRLMSCFAKYWFTANPKANDILKNQDVAYVLAFSIIMLNTDLHNDQVQDKMTVDQFVKNNRGINDGEDVERAFLSEIYDAIRGKQIRIKHDPAGGSVGGDEAVHLAAATWDSVVRRQQSVANAAFTPKHLLGLHAGVLEREMFCMISDSALDAIDVVYDMTIDSSLALKAIEGFHNYAKITAYYKLDLAFNHLMILLNRRFSAFVGDGHLWHEMPQVLRRRSSSIDSLGGIAEDEDARPFNRGVATLETIVTLTRVYGNHLCEGWRNVIGSILLLHSEKVLPSEICDSSLFVESLDSDLAWQEYEKGVKKKMEDTEDSTENEEGGGILSSFASWFGAVDEVAETEEEDMERRAQETRVEALKGSISPLALENLFKESNLLPNKSFTELLKALILVCDPSNNSDNHAKLQDQGVFCIDMLSIVALANPHRIALVWDMLHSYFDRILRGSGLAQQMPLLVSRIAVCILKICYGFLSLPKHGTMLMSALGLLTRMDLGSIVLEDGVSLAYVVGKNTALILKRNGVHFQSAEMWELFVAHLKFLTSMADCRPAVLNCLEQMITENLVAVSNVDLIVPILISYLQRTPQMHSSQGLGAGPDDIVASTNESIRSIGLLMQLSRTSSFLGRPNPAVAGEHIELWAKVLHVIGQYFYDASRNVSAVAYEALQRSLLDPPTPSPSEDSWYFCFESIILPLVDIHQRDHLARLRGTETHVRAVALLARTFLYNKRHLTHHANFHKLWLKVVSALSKPFGGSMPSGEMTSLQFTARESLKNLLLVSKADGMFQEVSERTQQDLLGLTWSLVDSLAPGIRADIEESLEGAGPQPKVSNDVERKPEPDLAPN